MSRTWGLIHDCGGVTWESDGRASYGIVTGNITEQMVELGDGLGYAKHGRNDISSLADKYLFLGPQPPTIDYKLPPRLEETLTVNTAS